MNVSPRDADWTEDGYVLHTRYTRNFFGYQTPIRIAQVAAMKGYAAADVRKPFTYCDLGCGEGVTLLNLATIHPYAELVGVDINAAHIASAQEAARAAGLTNIRFVTASFDEFAKQAPDRFDFVAAHGVLSWIAPEVQDSFRRAVQSILCPERGLLYCGYAVLPGMNHTMAVYNMVHACLDLKSGPVPDRVRQGAEIAKQAQALGFPLFRKSVGVSHVLTELDTRGDGFMAHEFGNKSLEPRYFREFRQAFARIGLTFVSSCDPKRFDWRQRANPGQLEFLRTLDPDHGEEMLSVLANESFRWDVYSNGNRQPEPVGSQLVLTATLPDDASSEGSFSAKCLRDGDLEFAFLSEELRQRRGAIHSLLSRAKKAGLSKKAVFDRIVDMIASREFAFVLETPERSDADNDACFAHAHDITRVLWERDFALEGRIILPSRVTGTASNLVGAYGLLAGYLHGRTVEGACAKARDYARMLNASAREGLKIPDPESGRRWEKIEARFRQSILPQLLRNRAVCVSETAEPTDDPRRA